MGINFNSYAPTTYRRPTATYAPANNDRLEKLSLEALRNYIITKRLDKNYDAIVAITGHEGSGKSTLALKLAQKLDPNFSLETHMIPFPTFATMKAAIKGLPPRSVIVADEAMMTLYKRQAMSTNVISMNQLMALCRKYRKVILYIMPRFEDFDQRMRDHRIALWIQCIDRGMAAVMYPSPIASKEDRWSIELLHETLETIRKGKKNIQINSLMILKAYKRHPGYMGLIGWNALAPEVEEEYLQTVRNSEEKYESDLDKPSTDENKWKARVGDTRRQLGQALTILANDLDMTVPDLSRKIGMSKAAVSELLAMTTETAYAPKPITKRLNRPNFTRDIEGSI